MNEISLTDQQKEDYLADCAEFRRQKTAIRNKDLSTVQQIIAYIELSKSVLDKNSDIALSYECSGRGLPAHSYYNDVAFYKNITGSTDGIKHLIDEGYLLKIKANNDRYEAGRAKWDNEDTTEVSLVNLPVETSSIQDAQERIAELENALHEIGTLAESGELEFYAVTAIIANALPE